VIGLLVLAVLVGYVALCFFLYRSARNRPQKIALIIVGLLVPFWDLPFAYLHYRALCSQEGGMHVLHRVVGAESIFFDGAGYDPQKLLDFGFKTLEYRSTTSKDVLVYTVTERGVEKTRQAAARSQLRISSVPRHQAVGWNTYRRDLSLFRQSDNMVLVRHTEFYWNGLWWQTALFPHGGSVGHCHANEDDQVWRVALKGSS
jgi:hypothetical protein